jgi:tRNA U55 pseudouridine synthase TruB
MTRKGQVVEEKPVASLHSRGNRGGLRFGFRGDFYQMPPMVSAIKINGVPLYKLARKGQEVEREPSVSSGSTIGRSRAIELARDRFPRRVQQGVLRPILRP